MQKRIKLTKNDDNSQVFSRPQKNLGSYTFIFQVEATTIA